MKEIFSYKVPYNKSASKDLIKQMIYLAQTLGFEEKNWVSGRELELLMELVRQYTEDIPLASRESIKEILKHTTFNNENKEIYIYRARLKSKGWIDQTPEGFELIPFLRLLKPMPEKAELRLLLQTD